MNNEKLKEAEIKFGNPLYVYDLYVIENQFRELNNGFRKISNFIKKTRDSFYKRTIFISFRVSKIKCQSC